MRYIVSGQFEKDLKELRERKDISQIELSHLEFLEDKAKERYKEEIEFVKGRKEIVNSALNALKNLVDLENDDGSRD